MMLDVSGMRSAKHPRNMLGFPGHFAADFEDPYGSLRVITGHYGSLRVITGHYGSYFFSEICRDFVGVFSQYFEGPYGSLRVIRVSGAQRLFPDNWESPSAVGGTDP